MLFGIALIQHLNRKALYERAAKVVVEKEPIRCQLAVTCLPGYSYDLNVENVPNPGSLSRGRLCNIKLLKDYPELAQEAQSHWLFPGKGMDAEVYFDSRRPIGMFVRDKVYWFI
jgi:hypothetical protein